MIYNRIAPTLIAHQSYDQYAFISGIHIEDALPCAEVTIEYTLEFNIPFMDDEYGYT